MTELFSHIIGIMRSAALSSLVLILFDFTDSITGCLPNEECFENFRYAHCVAVGFNYPGNHLFHHQNFTLSECNQECQSNSECEHSTFVVGTSECFGKHKKGQNSIVNDMNIITIPKICVPGCTIDAFDFPYNDFKSSKANSYHECNQQCQVEPDCLIGVWVQAWSHIVPNTCYLKNTVVMSSKRHFYSMMTLPKYCLEHHRLPNNEFQFKDSKYQFIAQNNSLEEGKEICEERNGTLVSMETKDEYFFIRSAILQLNTLNSSTFSGDYRIGLIDNSPQWTWSSGLNYDRNKFNIWCPGAPSGTSNNSVLYAERSCITLKIDSRYVKNLICEFSACLDLEPPGISNSNQERQSYPLGYR